jgi:hypothetical protein
MALSGNQKPSGRQDQAWCEEKKIIASAKIDEMLLEAIIALEQTRALHETTPNPETKRQAKRILDSLHSSLLKLAPLGIHSVTRLAQFQGI